MCTLQFGLEEAAWVGVSDAGQQQALGLGGAAGDDYLDARHVRVEGLSGTGCGVPAVAHRSCKGNFQGIVYQYWRSANLGRKHLNLDAKQAQFPLVTAYQ